MQGSYSKKALLIAALAASLGVAAQDTIDNKFRVGINVRYGAINQNLASLRTEGCMLGYPHNTTWLFSEEVLVGNPNKFYFSFSYSAGRQTAPQGVFNTYNVTPFYSIQSFGLQFYYPFINTKPLKVYSVLGTSFAFMNISSLSNGQVVPNPVWDTITVFENSRIQQIFLCNLGLKVTYYPFKKFEYTTGLTLDAGYNFALTNPSSYTWYDCPGGNEKSVIQPPSVNFNGWYASFGVSVWFKRQKNLMYQRIFHSWKTGKATPDSLKDMTRQGISFYYGAGVGISNFSGLRQNPEYLGQPANAYERVIFNMIFGNPEVFTGALNLHVGVGGPSTQSISNGSPYTVTGDLFSVGVLFGREVYHNHTHKFIKSIYPAIGPSMVMEDVQFGNYGQDTYNQLLLNADVTFNLTESYGKMHHCESGINRMSWASVYGWALKIGYAAPLGKAENSVSNYQYPISSLNMGGFYATIGLHFGSYINRTL